LINPGYQALGAIPKRKCEYNETVSWNTHSGQSHDEPYWNAGFVRSQNQTLSLFKTQENNAQVLKTSCNQDDNFVKIPLTIQQLKKADNMKIKEKIAIKEQWLNAWVDSQVAELDLVNIFLKQVA
jgi:hypothetical protein